MSKKFTFSLLVLAATLLALPINAQLVVKKQARPQYAALKAGPLKPADLKKAQAARLKAESKNEGQTFTGQDFVGMMKACVDNAHKEKAALAKEMERKLNETIRGLEKSNYLRNSVLVQIQRPINGLDRQTQPVISRSRLATGVRQVTPPAEATVETWYTAEGSFYANGSSGWQDATADMETVSVAIDGTDIYIQGLAYWFEEGWIQGTINGTTATFANGQLVGEDEYGPEYIVGSEDGQTVSESIVFNYSAEEGVLEAVTTFILENSKTDQVSPYCYWVSPTFSKNEPVGPEVVTPPAGIEAVDYVMSYTTGSSPVKVAVDGNDVYFQGMSSYIPDAWVKGTKDGNNVTFAGNQYMGQYSGYDSYFFYNGATTFVYDAEADTYSATGQVFGVLGGKYYDGNYTDPVLSRVYEIAATPANPAITDLQNGDYGWYITFNVPLQDTEGNPLVASKLSYEIFTDVQQEVAPLTFTPATHSKLTEDMTVIPYGFTENYDFYDTQIYLNDLYSASWNKIGIKSIYTGGGETHETEIQWYTIKPYGEAVAETGANVEELPYSNALDSEASFGEFGVIDSNNDGKTWSFSASNGANYSYSSTNAANDWLISPAIKLEAGKKYHFAIDAKNNGYTEKFEVLLGAEAKASALTQSVIEEQVVNNAEFVTFENEAVEVAETGYYHFGIHAISDADQFRLMVANFLVEAGVETDAPAAVTDFALAQTEGKLEVTVSFKAPTKTSGGDDLTDNLTKIEILRDGAVIKTLENVAPGAEVNYVDNDEALKVGTYTYQVIPYNAAGIGVKSEEKSIFLSVVLDVPYTFDFSQNLLDLFGVIDNNADGKTWSWSASNGAYYPYSGTNDADDYLITLPFNLEASKTYNVIVAAKNTGYVEKFEVKAGKTATVEGLTETIIPETVAESQKAFIDYEGMFKPAEDGQYYIAIHAISPADQFNLLISSLTIELAPEATAPAAIADFAVAAGAEGALEANLSFTAPAKAINGEALTGNVDVKIYRDGELINTLTGFAAGSAQTWKDTNVEDGKTYTYYLVAANESGDGLKSEKASVYIGVDELGGVPDFAATSVTASNITFTWKPAEGVHGGYINTDAIVYTVYSMHIEEVEIIPGWTMQELVADDALATVTGATTATVDFNTLVGDQEYKYFGISASDGTDETDPADAYTYVLVGAPYELPIAESFVGNQLHYNWESNGGLGIDNASSDGDGVALKLYNDGTSAEVFFALPRVDLASAVNPTIIFDAKNGLNVDKVKVIGSADGAEYTVLGEFDITSDYTTIKQALSSVKGTAFSSVGILATIPTASLSQYEDYVVIDNIRIVDLYEYNLTADIQAPKSVVAGQKAKIVATVTNEGENAAEGYTVEIKANGKVLTTVVADKALDSFAKDVIEVDYETSVFDEAGDVTLTVNVDFGNELYPDDNTASTIITVKEPTAISPASLLAEDKGVRGVDLTWAMTAEEVEEAGARAAAENSEDFEDQTVFEPFSLGGITAEEHYGAFGDWTLYDGNGIGTYGFQNIEFENAYQPMAFIVFDPNAISESVAETYAPHSGDQFLLSFCPVDENSNAPAADHWLISPELSGNAQTISFFARVITDQYGPETFEVLASSTDNQAASFAKVADFSTTAIDWEEFTAELPAGSKFFAIRHTSEDVFGLLVDDVTFAAAGASAPVPTAFNIYYNGEKIGTAEAEKTSYNVPFEKIAAGEQVFGVSAVYANGAESKAVTDTITIAPVEPVIAEGKYYLLNVAADGYVVGANDWGTRASITKQGGLEIEAVLANGKYELTTASVYPGKHLGFNGYVDNGDLSNWILDPVEGKDGVFMLSTDGTNVLFWDGGEATTTSVGAMPEVAEKAYWKFVPAEDRLAMLKKANAENPVDATFLIVNPNFGRASNKATWQGDDYGIGGANDNFNAEKWGGNSQLFDVHQTISVPDGIYKLTWNGFYRYNNTGDNTNAVAVAAHADGTEVINSFVYANDTTFALTSIADDAAVAALTALGKELPFSQGDASFAFSNGIYEQSAEIIVKDGQLTIGVKKTDHPGTDWTVWDNFRLTYYGVEVNDDDPELEAPEGWTKAIANGNLAGDNVASFVSKEYPSSDIVPSRIVAGAGKNNSRGIVVKAGDDTANSGAQAWDSQFWIQLNEKLPEGSKIHIEFDYKASKAAKASTQAHSNPGNYLHWAMMGDVNFTGEWQHFSADVDVTAAMAKGDNGNGSGDGLFSIAFNLQEEKSAVDYYFDNFGVWYQMPVVDGINAMKNEEKAKSIYNLNGQKVNVTKKGLYIKNGKKVVIK